MRSLLVNLIIISCTVSCSEDHLAEESTLNHQEVTIFSEESKEDKVYSERAELIFPEDKVTLTKEVLAGDSLIVPYDLIKNERL